MRSEGGQLPLFPLHPHRLSCSKTCFRVLAEEFAFDLKLVHQEKTSGFAFPGSAAMGSLPFHRDPANPDVMEGEVFRSQVQLSMREAAFVQDILTGASPPWRLSSRQAEPHQPSLAADGEDKRWGAGMPWLTPGEQKSQAGRAGSGDSPAPNPLAAAPPVAERGLAGGTQPQQTLPAAATTLSLTPGTVSLETCSCPLCCWQAAVPCPQGTQQDAVPVPRG